MKLKDMVYALWKKLTTWSGFNYTWDVSTNNTTDTWFPVVRTNIIEHAVVTDYVTETGTNGIWKYRKWKSGRYEAYYRDTIKLAAGTAWGSGFYYHPASSTVPPPSFSKSVLFFRGTPQSAALCWCVGYGDNYQTYWVNASSGTLNGLQVLLEIEGTWK